MSQAINPEGWARPVGFSHGMLGAGRVLAVAGQVGSGADGRLAPGLVSQFDRALGNVAEVVEAAGGRIEDLVSMTNYVLDRGAYLEARPALAEVWRQRAGR